MLNNFKEELRKVKAFVFDLDGVLSTQRMYLDASGIPLRTVNVKDGYALKLAVTKGYPVAVISGGASMAVRRRMRRLGIRDVHMNARNKLVPFEQFLKKYKFTELDILYMGDDLPDLPVMKKVGFPTCPADAVTEVKQVSHYISHFSGGDGCVRDVIEQVLRLHQQWTDDDSFQW